MLLLSGRAISHAFCLFSRGKLSLSCRTCARQTWREEIVLTSMSRYYWRIMRKENERVYELVSLWIACVHVCVRNKVCIDVMWLPIVHRYWVAAMMHVRVATWCEFGISRRFHTPDFLYPACKTFLITVIMLVRVSLMEKLSLTDFDAL